MNLILKSTHYFLSFRSFDARKECCLRVYTYLIPAECIGINNDSSETEINHHLMEFNGILKGFEVCISRYLTIISFNHIFAYNLFVLFIYHVKCKLFFTKICLHVTINIITLYYLLSSVCWSKNILSWNLYLFSIFILSSLVKLQWFA